MTFSFIVVNTDVNICSNMASTSKDYVSILESLSQTKQIISHVLVIKLIQISYLLYWSLLSYFNFTWKTIITVSFFF